MENPKANSKKYIFVGKTLFFPKEKLVAVGDLHLGYEEALRQRGLEVPIGQFKEVEAEIVKALEYIKAIYGAPEKIIFLGDIKHHFGYLESEKTEVRKLITFLKRWFDENNIIFVKGNHEKNEKSERYRDYYIQDDVAFTHGHKEFLELYDNKINLIVIGHIHPTITLEDKMKIKREKYKCFLVGKWKKKEVVIVPSFLSITEGVSFNEFANEREEEFSIIPQKEIGNFQVYTASEPGEEALNFGKLKEL